MSIQFHLRLPWNFSVQDTEELWLEAAKPLGLKIKDRIGRAGEVLDKADLTLNRILYGSLFSMSFSN